MEHAIRPAALAIQESGWIAQVDWLARIDSTSSEVRRRLEAIVDPSDDSRFLVVADAQSAGRGRSGNLWWSPSGCLMLSIALATSDTPSSADRIPLLALHVGLAVAHSIEAWQVDALNPLEVALKWPNDVFLGQKKTAGILIESAPSPSGPRWIVGIGLNVQLDWNSAPAEIARRATCLSTKAGVEVDSAAVLVHLIDNIRQQVTLWQAEDAKDAWYDAWQQRCLLFGKTITLLTGGQTIEGQCHGVDKNGRLVVQAGGDRHAIQSAEILRW